MSAIETSVRTPGIAVRPGDAPWIEAAIERGGGRVDDGETAEGLVWLDPRDLDGLGAYLREHPTIRWVQLPTAGIERVVGSGLLTDRYTWTCAKGAFREPVAEHALMLALAGLRDLPTRIRAKEWGTPAAVSLYDQPVTIVGGGGICTALLELLAPMRVAATVVRRSTEPVPGAARTVGMAELESAVRGACVVFVAVALTDDTTRMFDDRVFAAMDASAWLVNVARGPIVDTDALLRALRSGQIAGAALDVTDPEPLPAGHPLWDLPNCIITPHTADTDAMIAPLLATRVEQNVRLLREGKPLLGLVDPVAGY